MTNTTERAERLRERAIKLRAAGGVTTKQVGWVVDELGLSWVDVVRLRASSDDNDHVLAARLATLLTAAGIEETTP